MQESLSLGPWLKQRRRILDLTQQELAQRAACSLSTLRKIEAGDLLPSKELARLLAVALDVPAAEQEAFVAFARDERRAILNPALVATLPTPGTPTPFATAQERPAPPIRRVPRRRRLPPLLGAQSK